MVKIEEEKLNLCKCLYDTIINEDNYCMWQDEEAPYRDHDSSDLKFVEDLLYEVSICEEDFDDDGEPICDDNYVGNRYERLCLLNNQQINIDGRMYSKVVRIMDGGNTKFWVDMPELERLHDITVWSNGALNWLDQRFYIYWRGINLGSTSCPPSMSVIVDKITTAHFSERLVEYAPELIEKGKLLDCLLTLREKARKFNRAIIKSNLIDKRGV